MSKLIEEKTVTREYGLTGINAIVRHNGDLLLITDGFGGLDDIMGGAVRWQHGRVYKLLDGDTLSSLRKGHYNEYSSNWITLLSGHDDCRPLLGWSGHAIAALAKKLNL